MAPSIAIRPSSPARGRPIFYGDATSPERLRRFGIASAHALVVTMDNPDVVESVVTAARAERPDLFIMARARDAEHAAKLYSLNGTFTSISNDIADMPPSEMSDALRKNARSFWENQDKIVDTMQTFADG